MNKKKEINDGILHKRKGYSYLDRDERLSKYRENYTIPFACPACNKLMYNLDNKYFYIYGCCHECYINFIEERGLSEQLLRDRKVLLEYLKSKFKDTKK